MDIQPKFEANLTVKSFAYAARKLADSQTSPAPAALYERILGEAEKHRSALRLVQRDAFEMMDMELRKHTLTKTEFQEMREATIQALTQAQLAITRIAAQYAPQKLAA